MPTLIVETGTGGIGGKMAIDIDLHSGQILEGSFQFGAAEATGWNRAGRLGHERELMPLPGIEGIDDRLSLMGVGPLFIGGWHLSRTQDIDQCLPVCGIAFCPVLDDDLEVEATLDLLSRMAAITVGFKTGDDHFREGWSPQGCRIHSLWSTGQPQAEREKEIQAHDLPSHLLKHGFGEHRIEC